MQEIVRNVYKLLLLYVFERIQITLFRVILRLCVPQLPVQTIGFHQRIMAAHLHYISLIEYGDFVTEPTGGKAMANINCGAVADDVIEF